VYGTGPQARGGEPKRRAQGTAGGGAGTHPERLRPLTPCHRTAFAALESWLTQGHRPPASHTVPLPAEADSATRLSTCSLTTRADATPPPTHR
jgi:hypothetical protein